MTTPTLQVENLETTIALAVGPLKPVDDVSFTIQPGKILGLVGESGSGKSTVGFSLMKMLDPPGRLSGGRILFNSTDIAGYDEPQMRKIRGNRIAMIFQDPMMTLNPVMTIGSQMLEAVFAHKKMTKKAAFERCVASLAAVGIPAPEERMAVYPHQMSGGMRQRVSIAIALLHEPDLIIADEPTTALDVTVQAQILSEVQKLAENHGTAFLWITHDLSVVSSLADDVAVMYAGRIVEQGATENVLREPWHPYTRGLIDSLPSGVSQGEKLVPIRGATPNLAALPRGCAFAQRCARRQEICSRTSPEQVQEDGRLLRCFHPLRDQRL